ncbi:MAG TPA: NosD domain-containing protein, partial [Solirubrobacterales bacterium]|nr:NosD domain-containing protein [Solirubrobacterales bacterium]
LTAAGVNGPCVGVEGPSGESVFNVEADDVSIFRLAIGGGSFGIAVINASEDFVLRSSWIGFNLEGGSAANNNIGVFIDPTSDGATIGGEGSIQRNVIGNSGVGLDVEGADETTIQGNYFGVGPNGSTPATNNKDIEVTDSTSGAGFEAENTVIGATVSGGSAETAACDGGCNVISGALAIGLDLAGNGSGQGEAPATGPTTVQGNYVGLNAAGTETVSDAQFGILAGGAGDALVGGPVPGAANFIAGGTFGVYGENGDDLEVAGNVIGIEPTGEFSSAPAEVGIFVFALTLSTPEAGATVSTNTVRMAPGSGVGIEHRFSGAKILGNVVEGGATGILTKGSANGSQIEDNTVVASEDSGIVLLNPDNEVFGNEVVESGEAGIEVTPGAAIDVSGNVIGGDSAADENAIFDSGGGAIEIFGIEESRNEARRNRGDGNGEGFIRVRGYEGSEPGNGVESPEISAAGKTETSGTAEPGAVVRVFSKASAEEGEIAGFVGQATANGSGQWTATYAGLPGGTVVTATQTLDGGTSGLSETAKTPPDPPAPPVCPQAGATNCGPPPPPPVTKPKVTIKKAPKAKSKSTTAKFVFKSSVAGSKFKCKLDKKAFANCRSPKTYKKLKPGKHVFKVKATNSAGTSPVVTRKFTVLPPE